MVHLQVRDQAVEVGEGLPALLRLLLLVIGGAIETGAALLLVPSAASAAVPEAPAMASLLSLLAGTGLALMGLPVVGAALFGRDQILRIDAGADTAIYSWRSALEKPQVAAYRLDDIECLDVTSRRHDLTRAPFALAVRFVDGRSVTLGDFGERRHAEWLRQRIGEMLVAGCSTRMLAGSAS